MPYYFTLKSNKRTLFKSSQTHQKRFNHNLKKKKTARFIGGYVHLKIIIKNKKWNGICLKYNKKIN